MKSKKYYIWQTSIMVALLSILIVYFATGCTTTKYVPVEYHTVEYRDKYVLDSIYYRDTVRIERRGDTVFNQVVKWRERFRVDTMRYTKVDSIPYIVEVEKIVEVNKLTWWQNLRLKSSNVILLIAAVLALIWFVRK